MSAFKLWNTVTEVEIIDGPTDSVIKFADIKSSLFLLTVNFELYHGVLEDVEEDGGRQRMILKYYGDSKFRSIDSCDDFLYVIDLEGRVFKFNESLEIVEEITLWEEVKTCNHGCSTSNYKVKVAKLAVGGFGILFVTENGQLWACGKMPQIDVNVWQPKRVKFFENRSTRAVNVGSDFAIVCVSKANISEDTNSDLSDSDVFVPNCPKCMSNLSNSENSSLSCSGNDHNSDGGSVNSKSDDFNHLNDKNYSPSEKTEKNIIFRNTEAARDFLTKQIIRMSSVGEEYFVECTEKPGKIIKENVTNMASLVYEGVKSLSKHVNGSFDNCNGIDKIQDISLSKLNLGDDLLLSVSQDISEKDLSEHDIEERCRTLAKIGSNLLNCEVWTWGNVTHGQLGIGDSIKRKRPIIITKLSNVGIVNVSARNSHASALTLDGRAYLWGRNDYNQVTNDSKMDQSSPKLYFVDLDERIRDVSCGNFQTVAITTKSNLKYMGKHQTIVENEASCVILNNTQEKQYGNGAILKEVLATSEYVLFNTGTRPDFISSFLTEEQQFLEDMLTIHSNLVKIISKNNAMSSNLSVYEKLSENFTQLLHLIVTNVNSLLEFFRGIIDESEIIIFKYLDEYIYSYQKYLNVINDFISLGASHNVSQLIDNSSTFYKLKLGEIRNPDKNVIEKVIYDALLTPNNRLEFYLRLAGTFVTHYGENNLKFEEIVKKWNHLIQDQKSKQTLAEKTNEFWQNSGRSVQYLCTPSRRLIRESRTDPIQVQNAGRFSSHWIILLNDILVHVNGSTTRTHHLSTVWVESRAGEEYDENRISLKMPEQELVLCTCESQQKAEWLQAIENGIKMVLHKTNIIRAPTIRSAEYTFTKAGFYKDAKYRGRWCDGKMQGTGRLHWKDGRIYTGEMNNNQISGFGLMDMPSVGLYEGSWKNNQPNGFGTLKYLNGDVYKGTFQDGVPHGHGSLKHGSFMASAASIYIGEWISGNKNGYGVMDDIVSGEKYLGTWTDNHKHGNGLMVTSDGVYYEGTFAQDVFCGNGLMILEDRTSYEGEFKGTGVLSGKGRLTLNSGHEIEGYLSGSLNDCIKISNGTLNLVNHSNSELNSIPNSFAKLCAPVEQKWKSLFKKCYLALGLYEDKPVDVQKLWQNIAISISNSYRDSLKLKDNDKNGFENSINDLDTIPKYCRTQIDVHNYQELKQYLQKAFENSHHPLGSLLTDLCIAYTTTYGGLRAHPLLLNHAVEELHSITKRLYEIINLLFPALPAYQDEITLTNDSQVINYRIILHPLLLPRVHSPLFILYTLHNKAQDVQYWKRLVEWNKYSDGTLLAFLAVDEKLLGSSKEQLLVRSSIKDNTFLEAIETLQLLKTTFCPLEKLLIIRQTFEKMTEIVQTELGQGYKWSMDDLFPAFLYVVVRARILQLGSEIHFIQDFVESSLDNGELGIMFTTLKACYQQILQEKTCINS